MTKKRYKWSLKYVDKKAFLEIGLTIEHTACTLGGSIV